MVRKQLTPQIWRDSYRLTDNNQGRFTAYGIILALGVLAALATALDLPALGNANRGALELVSVPDEATAAPLGPLPKIDVETEEWSEPELATSPPAAPEQARSRSSRP